MVTVVCCFEINFFTRKKLFFSKMYPKTYANSLFLANTLQFYASFMDFKSILEELTPIQILIVPKNS